jgi:hypothetical protein
MKRLSKVATGMLGLFCIFALAATGPAGAGSTSNGNAGLYWGMGGSSASSQGNSSAESSVMHYNNATLAAQNNLAKKGLLLGTNISVYAIGTQNIVSVTGNNNSVSANQNGTNSGDISNNGTVGN